MDDWSPWIGNTETVTDDLSLATAAAAAAMFDWPGEPLRSGDPLPRLWHWFYFLPKVPQHRLGADGHPEKEAGGFMPPIPLPRRMFAGARLTWHRPLLVGQPAQRESTIRDVVAKSGRSGRLAFVTVAHRFYRPTSVWGSGDELPENWGADRELCIEEEQDIVYREMGPPLPAPQPVVWPDVPAGTWTRVVAPDSRLLFRFSALTFNAHRIHYDRPYATAEEGYPGLVVHGPLTAMLLLHLAQEQLDREIASFQFRGQGPLFDLAPFRLVGRSDGDQVELLAQGPDGKTAVTATATL